MRPTAEPLPLPLHAPFRVAHGASTQRTNVLVRLGAGVGEAGLPPYYPATAEDVMAYVEACGDALPDDPLALDRALAALPPGPAQARCAIDVALHDRWGRALDQPLYRLWGLRPEDAPASTVTLGLPTDEAVYREQLARHAGYPLLKLKLGSGDAEADLRWAELARQATEAMLCVDANGGWTVDQAAWAIPRLGDLGVVLVEEPIRSTALADWQALRERLPRDRPPLYADESLQSVEDLLRLAPALDGANVKLAKAGGLAPARLQLLLARHLGLGTLLGCMIESSVAVTAAAHLAPLADYVDLDASLHLAADPFAGVRLDAEARLVMPDAPGLGVRAVQA